MISSVTREEPEGGAEDLLRADFKSQIRRVGRKPPEEGRMECLQAERAVCRSRVGKSLNRF